MCGERDRELTGAAAQIQDNALAAQREGFSEPADDLPVIPAAVPLVEPGDLSAETGTQGLSLAQ